MQCRKCGSENQDYSLFCANCGRWLTRRPQSPVSPNDRSSRGEIEVKRRSGGGVAFLVFIGLGLLALIVIALAMQDTPGTTRTTRSLSTSSRQQIYKDMIEAQSQNPYVRGTDAYDEYTKGVLQGTSEAHDIPMDKIDEILDEGISEHWPKP